MARWYEGRTPAQLCAALDADSGRRVRARASRYSRANGVEVVIASITWSFAVEWVASRLGIERTLGTRLEDGRLIVHVCPRDKPIWLEGVMSQLEVPRARAAAVGDSRSDTELLAAAELRFFVGSGSPPAVPRLLHRPDGDIEQIAREILAHWPG
jgi:phosphoserine phosphatase